MVGLTSRRYDTSHHQMLPDKVRIHTELFSSCNRPEICYPAQGFEILRRSKSIIDERNIPLIRTGIYAVQADGERILVNKE